MKLLLVEDDVALSKSLTSMFKKEGYEVDTAYDGVEGYSLAETGQYDAVILDVMLPYMDGFEVLNRIRKNKIDVAVLMLTAKDDVDSRVKGLDNGADDYLIKPFAMPELFARLRVLLRRKSDSIEEVKLVCGTIVMYPEQARVEADGIEMALSKKEFRLLEYLLWNVGRILTKDQILDRVWGMTSDASDGIVDVYIHYLRKKLAQYGVAAYLETVRGIGYRLKEQD
ncbi:MAG: response regulator transcription factor [Bacillaceae bacterium]